MNQKNSLRVSFFHYSHYNYQDGVVTDACVDDLEYEDEEDGVMDDDSSDSLHCATPALSLAQGLENPYLLKRMSGASGALFYQVN